MSRVMTDEKWSVSSSSLFANDTKPGYFRTYYRRATLDVRKLNVSV